MSTITAENILTLIEQLPAPEQIKLREMLSHKTAPTNGKPAANAPSNSKPAKAPLDKRLPPFPLPDPQPTMDWLSEHQREYAGQWVALDGSRLIAADKQHEKVWAAAKADGAYLPLITLVEDPDNIVHIIWA